MPARVSITSPAPRPANLARRLRTWLSMVRSVMAKPGPCSRSMIASREKTLLGMPASSKARQHHHNDNNHSKAQPGLAEREGEQLADMRSVGDDQDMLGHGVHQ